MHAPTLNAPVSVPPSEIQAIFKLNESLAGRYKKFKAVDARLAIPGEKIDTIINGELETTNTAGSDSVVIKNKTTESQEEYIIGLAKFKTRYTVEGEVTNDWVEYQPIGETDAFPWNGEDLVFTAPWGEDMILKNGDMLCRTPGSTDDIYRIALEEFNGTYKLA